MGELKLNVMIKLNNPYARLTGYNCFGCNPGNPLGLKMEFYEDGDEIVCRWQPDRHYQGFHDILHGGIQATMMDEIASWVVFIKLDTAGVTYCLDTKYRKPVRISAGLITLRARFLEQERRIASVEVKLEDGNGTVCSDGVVKYFTLPREKAIRDMHFPGKDAFLKTPEGYEQKHERL